MVHGSDGKGRGPADTLARRRGPSYVEPAEHKLPINAEHPRLAEVTLVKERDPFEFDPRLI